jgi:hypothetical protein
MLLDGTTMLAAATPATAKNAQNARFFHFSAGRPGRLLVNVGKHR